MYINLFFSLLIFHFCSFAKKTITNVALVFIFCYPYKITTKDDDEPPSSSSFIFSGVENDDELGGASSFVCFFS
jgi:hypothetical protein